MRAMKTVLKIIRTGPRVSGFTIFGMTPGGGMPGGATCSGVRGGSCLVKMAAMVSIINLLVCLELMEEKCIDSNSDNQNKYLCKTQVISTNLD